MTILTPHLATLSCLNGIDGPTTSSSIGFKGITFSAFCWGTAEWPACQIFRVEVVVSPSHAFAVFGGGRWCSAFFKQKKTSFYETIKLVIQTSLKRFELNMFRLHLLSQFFVGFTFPNLTKAQLCPIFCYIPQFGNFLCFSSKIY